MSYKSNWANGGWLTICDVCGRKFKEDRLRMRWDGLMTCEGDWEVRQPQDFVRGVADIQAPPFVRPEQQNSFLPYNFTQYPEELVEYSERISKSVTKVVGDRSVGSVGALDGDVLNGHYLGYSDVGVDLETVLITESVAVTIGKIKDISETVGVAETVSRLLVSASALNGSALNSSVLD